MPYIIGEIGDAPGLADPSRAVSGAAEIGQPSRLPLEPKKWR